MTSTLINELNQDVIGENKITTQQVAQRLAQIPVSFEPGTDYNYGLSADILGAVIEKVSGEKLSEFLKKRIYLCENGKIIMKISRQSITRNV